MQTTLRTLAGCALRYGFLALASTALAGPALAQKPGGTVTVGLELDIPGFDPLKVGVFDTAAESAAALIFDTLTTLDDDGNAQPKLAVSWSPSEDRRTWTFKLRPGVTFQDGTPFNAQAVAWNYARQKDPKNNCRCAFYIQAIERVEATDDLTVAFHLRNPSALFPAAALLALVEQRRAVPCGDRGEGRRLQPQSGRHRSVRREVLDRRGPDGVGAQSELLEQGPSAPRPRGAAAAAGCAVALRKPARGRDRSGLGG